MTRLVIRSRLGNIVTSRAIETIGPRYLHDGDKFTPVRRYIVERQDTIVLLGIDRQNRVYLIGGFTDYNSDLRRWLKHTAYHHYASPKFIGHLQEIV